MQTNLPPPPPPPPQRRPPPPPEPTAPPTDSRVSQTPAGTEHAVESIPAQMPTIDSQQTQHTRIQPPHEEIQQRQTPPPPHPPHPGSQGPGSFQEGFGAALMAIEELRQGLLEPDVTGTHCIRIQQALDQILPILFSLRPTNPIESDLLHHAHTKAASSSLEALQYVTSYYQEENDHRQRNTKVPESKDIQGGIARLAELALVLHENDPPPSKPPTPEEQETAAARKQESITTILDTYVAYQRKVIRARCKPAIKKLVARRQLMKQASSWFHRAEEEDADDDHHGNHSTDNPNDPSSASEKATHSHVLTMILSQASSLIHPLSMWKASLPPHLVHLRDLCTRSIATVDEQAQTMSQTITGWYMEDHEIDSRWMPLSAAQDQNGNASNGPSSSELTDLDAMVDELAFACQVMDRYLGLLASEYEEKLQQNQSGPSPKSMARTPIQELHPEWTFKYASLERYLTTQQLQSALKLAQPVQIVLGTKIQVPSVVEDAQYLSTRALERASSARSSQAIGTVAHAIATSIWSTETGGGVHQALLDQRGCYKEESRETTTPPPSGPSSNGATGERSTSFASALLGALDDDLGTSKSPTRSGVGSTSTSRTKSPPSSGNFLGLGSISSSLAGGDRLYRIRMDTYLCALNGIHSASVSCTSIVHELDSLLEPEEDEDMATSQDQSSTTMIQLAREELVRYSKDYQRLLESQVQHVVSEFCGSVQEAPVYRGSRFIPILRYYLERENYQLGNAEDLRKAEDESRLHQQILEPMQQSAFLQQLGKCDMDVLVAICGELASRLVELLIDCITSPQLPKKFTDWGSLLFSKQVRMIQGHLSNLMEKASDGSKAIPILSQWERLSQVVTVLQLEKPSDWKFYEASSTLTSEDLQRILSLKVGFSAEAIAAVVGSSKS